jgi:hypothetical protein
MEVLDKVFGFFREGVEDNLEKAYDYGDSTGAMGIALDPQMPVSVKAPLALYQYGRDLLGFNEQAQERAIEDRQTDEDITPTRNSIYDYALEKGASPYVASQAGAWAEVVPGVGEGMGVEETFNLIEEGRYLEAAISGTGTVVGAVPLAGDILKTAAKAAKPKELFLNARAVESRQLAEYQKALDLEKAGASPEDIWKETGWGNLFGEWVTETNDGLTYTRGMLESGVAAKNLGKSENSQAVSDAVKNAKDNKPKLDELFLQYRELHRLEKVKFDNNSITQPEFEAVTAKLQKALDAETNNIKSVAAPKTEPLNYNVRREGSLPEVLINRPPDLDYALNSGDRSRSVFGLSKNSLPQASTGVRKNKSGGGGSYSGNIVGYKSTEPWTSLSKQDEIDRSALDAGLGNGGAAARQASDEYSAKMEWSTLLHETQHYLDDVFRSTSGRGSSSKDADTNKAVKNWATVKYNKDLEAIKATFPKGSPEYLDAVGALGDSKQGRASRTANKGGYDKFERYSRDGGEAKARLVQARRNMTDEQRRAEAPWKTLETLQSVGGKYPTNQDEVFSLTEFGPYYDADYQMKNLF